MRSRLPWLILIGVLAVHGLSDGPAQAQGIIVFTQDGCPACRSAEPSLVRLEKSGTRVVRYRATAADPVCRTLGIQTTPTFIAVDRQGREVQRIVGATEEAKLMSLTRRAYSTR